MSASMIGGLQFRQIIGRFPVSSAYIKTFIREGSPGDGAILDVVHGNESDVTGIAHFASRLAAETFAGCCIALQTGAPVYCYGNTGTLHTYQLIQQAWPGDPQEVVNDTGGLNWKLEVQFHIRCIAPL
jgi:hypothetical protein